MTAPAVSVVITAHNEARGIGATLLALRRQTIPPETCEVILVDDRSTDGTAEAARAAGHPGLIVLPAAPDPAAPLTTRQQALDLGFARARGDVVLTLDGDCVVPPGWLAAMTAPIRVGAADAVAGPIGFAPVTGPVAAWQNADAAYYFAVSALVARAGLAPGVFFGNFAFRRDLHAATGGFARIGFALTEDLAFARALHAAGARFAFAAARADVAPCPDAAALVRRTMRVAQGPASALAAVLAVIPLTLILPALLALVLASPEWGMAALARWALGAAFVGAALWRHGVRVALPAAAVYEPGAILLALAVLAARARGARVGWGGGTMARERAEALIRPYRAADRDAVRAINIRTAYRNKGAEWLFEDTEVHADYWTRYYTDIRPADTRIVEIGGEVAGYFFACFDHRHFVRTMATRIVPAAAAKALWRLARGRYRRPESRRYLRHMLLVAPGETPDFPFGRYPAHYHCNLTRRAYGRGLYTRLVLDFLDALEARGISRLHGSITEPREGGIWARSAAGLAETTGRRGPPVVPEVFAEKPTRLLEAVLGDPTPMVNRAWGVTTDIYRAYMAYLRDEMRL